MMRKVAILGAGAVGSYVIWGLSGKEGIELGIIADGERAARFVKNGCVINGTEYRPQVWSPDEAGDIDLLVVALKYGALEGAMESIRKVTSDNTVIMSLMNGVDSEEIIGRAVGEEHMIYSLIRVASHKEDRGYIFDPDTTIGIIFGEIDKTHGNDRVHEIEKLFENTGIHYRATEFIREEIWSKFCLNVCNNLPQAVVGAGVGCYNDSEHMRAVSDGLRSELKAIAAAKGIDMSKAAASSIHGSPVAPSTCYSTLQDLNSGRHTEIEMFSGVLMRMGKELGIPTPYNEYTYHIIKALEEKNDGLFDYSGRDNEMIWSK